MTTGQSEIGCPRTGRPTILCAARDGRLACLEDGTCVGCMEHSADLLRDLTALAETTGETK